MCVCVSSACTHYVLYYYHCYYVARPCKYTDDKKIVATEEKNTLAIRRESMLKVQNIRLFQIDVNIMHIYIYI